MYIVYKTQASPPHTPLSAHQPTNTKPTNPKTNRLTAARRAHFWRPILATRLPVLALQLQEQEARAEKQQRRQRRREEEDEESEAGGMAGPFLPLAHSHSASSAVSILSLSPPRRGGVGKRRGSCGGWEDPEAAAEAEAAEGNGGNGSGSGSGGSNVYFASLRAYGESVLRRQSLLEGALPRYGDLVLGCVVRFGAGWWLVGWLVGVWGACPSRGGGRRTLAPPLVILTPTSSNKKTKKRFEVWDAADGLRLLSASGPFCVVPIEGARRIFLVCVLCVWLIDYACGANTRPPFPLYTLHNAITQPTIQP